MIPIPRTMMHAPSSSPILPTTTTARMNTEPKPPKEEAAPAEAEEEEEEEPVSRRPDHVGLCGRSECIRTRALLATKPQIIYRPIEQVRVHTLRWWWLLSLVIALGWSVACIQKKQVILGLVNFVGAFLVLWRQIYVDTSSRMVAMAWIIMAVTFYVL